MHAHTCTPTHVSAYMKNTCTKKEKKTPGQLNLGAQRYGASVPKASSWQQHPKGTVFTGQPQTLKAWLPLIQTACLLLALLTAGLFLMEPVAKTGLMGEVKADC